MVIINTNTEKPVKFFDGAFGTYYVAKTHDYRPCEAANIYNSALVLDIHKEYIAAGAEAIKTNTFSANAKVFDSESRLREIITQGYLLANQAAEGTGVEVFADIGNISGEENLPERYLQVTEIFLKLGATKFLFETLASFDEIVPALKAIKEKDKNAAIAVSFAASVDGFTLNGLNYRQLIEKACADECVDIVGLNCICGPAHILSLKKELPHIEKPLIAMPNAGYPAYINGRMVYNDNKEYFAEKLLELSKTGVTILGGCCGTTPAHIESAARLVRAQTASTYKTAGSPARQTYSFIETGNKLKRKPIAVELDPPPDCDNRFIMEAAKKLKDCGVSTITLADSPLAKTRADSFLTAALIKREIGIDVLPHLTCRDKNYIAIKGTLLGASFYGVNKVLAITGDPIIDSDNYRNPGVFNFNSKELIGYLRSLNSDVFKSNPFSLGGALNVNANKFEAELKRCKEKIAAGAEFLLSQPIFSEASVQNFIKAKSELSCEIYAGILPVVSYKNAVFLNNEFSGIEIPQGIIDLFENKTPEQAFDVSIKYCCDIIKRVYDYADGFYIMTPMKKTDLVCGLIERCFDAGQN